MLGKFQLTYHSIRTEALLHHSNPPCVRLAMHYSWTTIRAHTQTHTQ